jgi:membrane-associated protein
MEQLLNFDLKELIATIGYVGIFGIIFAESGLLIGFFLPGDSLLFTAGLISSQEKLQQTYINLSFPVLLIGFSLAAIAGDSTGYWFGHRVGRKLFQREDSLLFKKKNLYKAQALYDKHGGKIIVIARFMPIVRTFAPIVAGIGTMRYRRFVSYNIVGGLLWAAGVTSAGYFLGNSIPNIDKYLLPIVMLIIIVSVMPPGMHVLREYMAERQTRKQSAVPKTDSEAN